MDKYPGRPDTVKNQLKLFLQSRMLDIFVCSSSIRKEQTEKHCNEFVDFPKKNFKDDLQTL